MATNFNQFIPYLIAKKKAKKNGIKVPNEALLGMMPRVDGFLHNYLLTDVATKKQLKKNKRKPQVQC